MIRTRRELVGAGLGLAGLGLLRARVGRAAEPIFTADPFPLGVASGYPEPNAIVLWTRLAPEPFAPGGGMPEGPVEVRWEIAADDSFRSVVRTGQTYATAEWAHSVHIEVAGLESSRDYWYRFECGEAQSPVGHTRTAPERGAPLGELELAVACCQMYEDGHYAAYRAMAADDLDLIVHVGDYIYEQRGVSRVRSHDAAETFTLEDYRLRYAIYKSDPHLRPRMRRAPGCSRRRSRGRQRLRRGPVRGRRCAGAIPRAARGRVSGVLRASTFAAPANCARRSSAPAHSTQLSAISSTSSCSTAVNTAHRKLAAAGSSSPCAGALCGATVDARPAQERWLRAGLETSRARWKLLGQQTPFAHFDQSGDGDLAYWNDGWSGYPAARARLVDFIAERAIANPVVLSGDIHAFMVNDVNIRPQDYDSPIVATELVTTSITSRGPPQQVSIAGSRESERAARPSATGAAISKSLRGRRICTPTSSRSTT